MDSIEDSTPTVPSQEHTPLFHAENERRYIHQDAIRNYEQDTSRSSGRILSYHCRRAGLDDRATDRGQSDPGSRPWALDVNDLPRPPPLSRVSPNSEHKLTWTSVIACSFQQSS